MKKLTNENSKASSGSVSYKPEKSCLVWKIKQFQGGKEFIMRAHFGLPSVQAADDTERKAPINIKYEIPYFTVSGIQVRYLKIVEKSGYQALPWVRYITQNGGKEKTLKKKRKHISSKEYTAK